jgi:flavin reductase (DIM6/NTAB) family NADH-FMN oxidoreductase RutF
MVMPSSLPSGFPLSDAIHFYEPRHGHGLPHDPFNAIVGPRPIGWLSSQCKDGTLNLAPRSFFNTPQLHAAHRRL